MWSKMIAGPASHTSCAPVSHPRPSVAAPRTVCKAAGQQQERYEGAPCASRRGLLTAWLATASAAALAPAATAAAPASLTPFQRGLQLEYGLTADGRIRACETDANPNCVGTANRNETYMPAWEAPQGSPADAMQQFEEALRSVAPDAVVVEAASRPGGEYRRFAVRDPLFDHDDIEVLIALQQAPYESEPPLVTFRSMAAEVKYVWPIQQAVTDFGAQRQRLKEVRRRLGWRLLGCDLIECYEE